MKEIIEDIKRLANNTSDHEYLYMGKYYKGILLDKKNFHNIPMISDMRNMWFVDGGSSILFEGAGFALGMIKVVAVLYDQNKRKDIKKIEFYILINYDAERLNVKTYPETVFSGLSFDPEDESLRNGLEKASCSRIINVIRKYAELDLASKNSALTIIDGTLEARYPGEDKYIGQLGDNVFALSKSCSLTTNTGCPITKRLYDMHDGAWHYYPIVQNDNKKHDADIYFIKLNDHSKHVFRFEAKKDVDASSVIQALAANSTDPVFLGYPYGLIDVDSIARISKQENMMMQTKFSVLLGKDWNEFSKSLNSMNAHDILDHIRF